MKKNNFIFCFFLLFVLPLAIQAQKIGYVKTDFSSKPKNLTKIVLENCKQSLRENIDESYLEIKYDKDSENLAKNLFPKLKESFLLTRKLLQPLKNYSTRIYLVKLKDVPKNYEIEIEQESQKLLIFLIPYEKNLNLDCELNTEIGKQIYITIPHELTHTALDGFVKSDVTWFQEGLAEYVSFLVSSKSLPKLALRREAETLPEVSLNRNEISEKLFDWHYSNNVENLQGLESIFFYGASHQLIKLLISKFDEKNPSQLLLKIIEKQKSLNSSEILEIIKNELHIDIKNIGILSNNRKKEIFQNALNLYKKEKNNEKIGYKFSSLATIAFLDELLPDEYFEYFFTDVFNEKNDNLIQCFASKSILKHLGQENFDKVFGQMIANDNQLKKFKTKDILTNYLREKVKTC